ncbi:MAG: hydroxymethylglutaryl-CoA lyase [Rhodobacteraceae bacterium]|nr:hydroxymethylglutaryl-CoA lyase [Paracoccaceae bacterium]
MSVNQNKQKTLELRELALRDGLQLTQSFPTTEEKIKLISLEYLAGVRYFEVGSFLPAKTFPQFADIGQLIAYVETLEGTHSSALTLNVRALDDALQTQVNEVVISLSATEEHCQANIKRSIESAINLIRLAINKRNNVDGNPLVSCAISVAFGCSIAGHVDPDNVVRIAVQCAEFGAEKIAVADTVGFAGPSQVYALSKRVIREVGDIPVVIHLHDTRGTGIANAYAALEAGVRVFDGTLGGLGGCPFAPGASGNVAFEDLVYLCERSGFPTGIDLPKLFEARQYLAEVLPNETLGGVIAQALPPKNIDWQAHHFLG